MFRVLLVALLLFPSLAPAATPVPNPPELKASSYILIDHDSGRVLAEHNSEARVEPASITKLMTTYVTFRELAQGNLRLEDKVTVSKKAWKTPGSRMFIEVGKQVSVKDLLLGIIIQSGNDASVALAEHIAGTEETFAQLMNQYAETLGLTNSNFVNSTGLPHPDHYSSAVDIVRLSEALIQEFPEYYPWFAQRKFTFNGIEQYNRNRMLWRDNAVDGLKTGHTESAGYCLAASAHRDGMRLTSAVLGTSSDGARTNATQALMNYGFRFFITKQVFDAHKPVADAELFKGVADTLPVGLTEALSVTVPRGRYGKVKQNIELMHPLTAPISARETVGTLTLTLDGEVVSERPLVALESIETGGLWKRLTDEVLLMFE